MHINGKMEVEKKGNVVGKGAHATVIIAPSKRLRNDEVKRIPFKNIGRSTRSELQLESGCELQLSHSSCRTRSVGDV